MLSCRKGACNGIGCLVTLAAHLASYPGIGAGPLAALHVRQAAFLVCGVAVALTVAQHVVKPEYRYFRCTHSGTSQSYAACVPQNVAIPF